MVNGMTKNTKTRIYTLSPTNMKIIFIGSTAFFNFDPVSLESAQVLAVALFGQLLRRDKA